MMQNNRFRLLTAQHHFTCAAVGPKSDPRRLLFGRDLELEARKLRSNHFKSIEAELS